MKNPIIYLLLLCILLLIGIYTIGNKDEIKEGNTIEVINTEKPKWVLDDERTELEKKLKNNTINPYELWIIKEDKQYQQEVDKFIENNNIKLDSFAFSEIIEIKNKFWYSLYQTNLDIIIDNDYNVLPFFANDIETIITINNAEKNIKELENINVIPWLKLPVDEKWKSKLNYIITWKTKDELIEITTNVKNIKLYFNSLHNWKKIEISL